MKRTEGRHVIVRAAAVCFLLMIAAGWIFFWRERQRQEELSFPADYYLCGGRNFYGAEPELEEALQDLLPAALERSPSGEKMDEENDTEKDVQFAQFYDFGDD